MTDSSMAGLGRLRLTGSSLDVGRKDTKLQRSPPKICSGQEPFFWLLNLQVIRNNDSGSAEEREHVRGLPRSTSGSEASERNRWKVIAPARALEQRAMPISRDYPPGAYGQQSEIQREQAKADHLSD